MQRACGVLGVVFALLVAASPALAIIIPVRAGEHSVRGGVPVDGFDVTASEPLSIAVLPGGLWRGGHGHPFTGAEGLPGSLFTHAGFAAPLGALVGEIGGEHRLIGAGFEGPAWGTGRLRFYHWGEAEAGAEGEMGLIIGLAGAGPALVTVVPAPAAAALLGFAALLLAAVSIRRTPRALTPRAG